MSRTSRIIFFWAFMVLLPLQATAFSCAITLSPGASPEMAQAFFTHAKTLGFTTVRVCAEWPRIQPQTEQWEFAWLDAIVNEAQLAGLNIILVFGPSPPWAISYLRHPEADAVARAYPDLPAFEQYVSAVATRYAKKVTFYQVWECPTATTLLAMPKDVHVLFRAATLAVHAVDPTLKVIVPEPGDVDISWIAGYLAKAQPGEAPDIVQLSPEHFTLDPKVFWWRVQSLHKFAFTSSHSPTLWTEIPLQQTSTDTAFTMATASLLGGITDMVFTPRNSADLDVPGIAAGIMALTGLQDASYAGWTLLAEDTPAGIFCTKQGLSALALPFADAHITFQPSPQPPFTGVVVPTGQLNVTVLGDSSLALPVTEPLEYALAPHPTLFSGIVVKPTEGTPKVLLPTLHRQEVSLDLSGKDPSALHLLRNMPGGQFVQETVDGRTVISTIAGIAPWIHVDVPDNFLFYNKARISVEVTVDVFGAEFPEETGFNLYYDALDDMRYSRWQWINVGSHQVFSYTFRLDDALFANRTGYDFRINMGGSAESVRVVDIRVKLLKKELNKQQARKGVKPQPVVKK